MTAERWVALGVGLLLGAFLGWLGGERSVCVATCRDLGFREAFVNDGVCDCPDAGNVTFLHEK